MKMCISSIEDLSVFARKVLEHILASKSSGGATVLALSGELGAGKTAFVKELAKILGIKEDIISPTFVIMKFYELQEQHFKKLIHIDAYRLKSGEELAKLGFEELCKDPNNLICIEWPEQVPDIVPKNSCSIIFDIDKGGEERNVCLLAKFDK